MYIWIRCAFFLLSLEAQPGLQEQKGCSFHYLPINVQTDDLQGPFQSFLQPNYETQSKSADMVLSHGSISEGRYKEIKQKSTKWSFKLMSCIAVFLPTLIPPSLSFSLSLLGGLSNGNLLLHISHESPSMNLFVFLTYGHVLIYG